MRSKEELFHSIYMQNMPVLRVIARRNGIPYDELDDFVQETFLSYYAAYFQRSDMDWSEQQIRAVLVKILKNRCIDYARFQARHPTVSITQDDSGAERVFSGKTCEQDLLQMVVEREKYEAVMAGIKSMKEKWADVLILHIIQQKPMPEVSAMLGVSEEACRMRLSRGRKYLVSYVQKWYGVEELPEDKAKDATAE